jgi:very-short-patch-repair endonuclease
MEICNINDIRFIEDSSNKKWFVAKDICDILKLSNTSEAVKPILNIYKKKYKIKSISGIQNTNTIDIDGIKYLLQNSRSMHKDIIIDKLNMELDIIYDCKESSHLKIISAAFKLYDYVLQYKIGKYRIDLYFLKYKLAIEVDEYNHNRRDKSYEKDRQKYIEDELGCEFIRFNPDEKNFNIGDIISIILSKIHN